MSPPSLQRVLDPEVERERIARARVEAVLERGAIGLSLRNRPLRPADEAVDGVPPLGLVERELVGTALELVRAVLDPVRPRREELAAAGAAELVEPVAVEHRRISEPVTAQTAADTDDDHLLVAVRQLDLLAGRAGRFLHARRFDAAAAEGFIPIGRCARRSRFLALSSHEPARVDRRRSRPDPVRDDHAVPLPVRAADARAGAARRDHADALVPLRGRGVAAADALLRDAPPDQLRDRRRNRARAGVRVRDELVGLLEVRRQRLRGAAGDRGARRVHARVDVPRALDLRLEPALAALAPRDALDRRRREAGFRATSSSSRTRGCSTRSATRSWTGRRS